MFYIFAIIPNRWSLDHHLYTTPVIKGKKGKIGDTATDKKLNDK